MSERTYGVSVEQAAARTAAPELAYRPPQPRDPGALPIALIGCGGISQSHLQAYRNGGFRVVALCDRTLAKAEARGVEFFPDAIVTTDASAVLAREDVKVVDITTHPGGRAPLIEAALRAGKHVLSQKPFVLDLAEGRRLADLADALGLRLAVNQNARWAPHFSYLREVTRAGLVGEVASVDFTLHWDHGWVLGTEFENVPQLILSDFAIHWFDLATMFFGERRALKVFAAAQKGRHQRARPPFLAQAAVEFEGGLATLAFNADCRFGQEDRTTVAGHLGTVRSIGPNLADQTVTLHTAGGVATPKLEGTWFPDGFQGAMAELLCAIEEDREPSHSARANLRSLALCTAAQQSAESGQAVTLGAP